MSDRSEILGHIAPDVRQWCGSNDWDEPSDNVLRALWQENITRIRGGAVWTLSHLRMNPLILHPDVLQLVQAAQHGAKDAGRLTALQQARTAELKDTAQEHLVTDEALVRLSQIVARPGAPEGLMQTQLDHLVALTTKGVVIVRSLPKLPTSFDDADLHIMTGGTPPKPAALATSAANEYFHSSDSDGALAIWQSYVIAREVAPGPQESSAIFEAMSAVALIAF